MWPDCDRRNASKAYGPLIENLTGIKLRETVSHIGAIIGSAVHRAAEFTMIRKLEDGDMGKDEEATEAALGELSFGTQFGTIWDQATPRSNDAEKQIIRMSRSYRQFLAPDITPIAVETRLEADLGDNFHLSGQSDVVTITPEGIDDLKTGVVQRVNMAQLGAYGITTEAHGYPRSRLVEDYIARVPIRAEQPRPVVTVYDRDVAEAVTWRRIETIKRQLTEFLKTGEPLVFPANPNSMLCSDKFCPAWGTGFCREHKGAK